MNQEIEDARNTFLDAIELVINQAIRDLMPRHNDGLTQEHQLTAKIAQVIENAVSGYKSPDFSIEVAVQDFPDKGPGTLESKTGADLYISVVLIDRYDVVSKGMLVQSKWPDTMKSAARPDGQIHKMRERTRSCYIWVYEHDGVTSIPVEELSHGRTEGQSVGSQIANGLRCTEGDRAIGRDTSKDIATSLTETMEAIGANTAVAFTVKRRRRRKKPEAVALQ